MTPRFFSSTADAKKANRNYAAALKTVQRDERDHDPPALRRAGGYFALAGSPISLTLVRFLASF